MKLLNYIWSALGVASRASIALIGVAGIGIAIADNYSITQGAGTNFASHVIGGINYAEQLICDATIGGSTNCLGISPTGTLTANIVNISGTVSLPTGAATAAGQSTTQPRNITQFGGTNIVSGTGASGAGIPRFTISNDSSLAANQSVNVNQLGGSTGGLTTWGSAPTGQTVIGANVNCVAGCAASSSITATQGGAPWSQNVTQWNGVSLGSPTSYGTAPSGNVPGANVFVTNTNSNGQATMANSSPVTFASNQSVGDPCMFQTKTNTPISTNIVTSILVPGIAAKKIYVCSIAIIASAATAVSLAEGASNNCVGSAAAVMGVSSGGTYTSGMSFAANGGMTSNGGSTLAETGTSANFLCLINSAGSGATVSGNLTYVQQ